MYRKTKTKIVVQPLSNNNSRLLIEEERRPYWLRLKSINQLIH